MTYRTFLRSARNWKEFASAEKIEYNTGLTYEEAREECVTYNSTLNEAEIETGTKMEFEQE